MELIFKSAAVALSGAVLGLVLKRTNPEISLALNACAVAIILLATMCFARGIKELADAVKLISGSTETFTLPILKCVAIAIVTKISSELCKDASQSAAAAAVELAGTVCAMAVAMPLIMNMLTMIGGMV